MVRPRSVRKTETPLPLRMRPTEEDWKDTFSFYDAEHVGYGSSGSVLGINSKYVIKVFSQDEEGNIALECEKAAYEKLRSNEVLRKHIIEYVEEWESGLVLERMGPTLRIYLTGLQFPPDPSLAYRWAIEASEGLTFLHSRGILQGDVGCHNILIDGTAHVKLCDFAGSKIGEARSWVCYQVRSQHPLYRGQQPTVKTEIFALGSVLFEIWTGRPPYASETNAIVRERFLRQEFPTFEIDDPEMQRIIDSCWRGIYVRVADISSDLQSAWEDARAS
jgi:serine/threonine protein kinase